MSGSVLTETFSLNTGAEIPKLGLGTWLVADDAVGQVVRDALDAGYRHIDTAQAYGNEHGIGEALRASGIGRDELFVTTKLAAESKDHADATARIDGSLKALGLDHINLMLIHSPQPWNDFRGERYFEGNLEAWRALEEAHQAGKLRAIGVSNFEAADLDNILDHGSVVPAVNQLLTHVGNTPFELIDYTRSKGILVEAYSPVGHGAVLKNPKLAAMAGKYGVSVAQLCIRYCLELDLLPLPKTVTPAHMRSNAAVDFTIAPADLDALKSMTIRDYGEAGKFPVFAG